MAKATKRRPQRKTTNALITNTWLVADLVRIVRRTARQNVSRRVK